MTLKSKFYSADSGNLHEIMKTKLKRYYKKAGLSSLHLSNVIEKIRTVVEDAVEVAVECEACFYVECRNNAEFGELENGRMIWILADSFKEDSLSCSPWISVDALNEMEYLVEIGPRLNFSTAFSTNAVSVCRSVGIDSVKRIEKSTRYLIRIKGRDGQFVPVNAKYRKKIANVLHDKMTECVYTKPLENFQVNVKPDDCYEIDIIGSGKGALEEANKALGLSFSEWDIDMYYEIFKGKLQRNPTSVECFDLAQSNSEHSRHWFFKGKMVIDGEVMADSLMKMVMKTQDTSNPNSLIKFSDNSR